MGEENESPLSPLDHLKKIVVYCQAIVRLLYRIEGNDTTNEHGLHLGGMGDVIGTLVVSQLPRWMFDSKSMPAKKLIRDAVKSLKEAIDIVMDMDEKDQEIRDELNSGAKASYPPMYGPSDSFCCKLRSQSFLSNKSVPHDDVLSNTLAENLPNLSISAPPVPSYSIADHLAGPLGPTFAKKIFIPCHWLKNGMPPPQLYRCDCHFLSGDSDSLSDSLVSFDY